MIGADAIRGHITLMVLAILEHQPSYAYEISRTITEISGGTYAMKQTTLYTAVKRLESLGYLDSYDATSDSGKSRTYYRLTGPGRAHLDEKRAEWQQTRDLVDHFVKGDGRP
ncbi:PadR family transcriptional regulator [Kocuria coralli]|uniref:PadR family transcriptional regulator n=1 Tax=Kocuria coralli TaxID=1461025 RepID=A0A5J5KZ88_9MICC|nr:PadR family transcriptional regulator [Kocuria coralli]KAA9394225.1 PadR family transcriptional regulator [Kocuria coralli]